MPGGAPRVQAGGAKYNFADAPDVDNFLDFVIYSCFYKYIYIYIYSETLFSIWRLTDTLLSGKTRFDYATHA